MKRLVILLMMLFVPFMVLAEECDSSNVTIASIEQSDIDGSTIEKSEPTIDGNKFRVNIKMFSRGDSISYELKIKNNGSEDFVFDNSSFDIDSDYLQYEISSDDNTNVIKANTTKTFNLSISYINEVPSSELSGGIYHSNENLALVMNTNDNVDETAEDDNWSITTGAEVAEVIDSNDVHNLDAINNVQDTGTVENPKTGIISVVVLLSVLIIVASAITIIIKLDKKNMNKIFVPIIALLLVIPVIVKAVCSFNIQAEINVELAPPEKVYDAIVKLASEENACVQKYEGEVTDEVGKTVTASNVYFDKCVDKRNVIFGGFCWQVIRTTETGGTKMIYNGEPVDGKCESTRGNHKGLSYYSVKTFSYSTYSTTPVLFGTSYTYDLAAGTFTLEDISSSVISAETAEGLVGKFTCGTAEASCTVLYHADDFATSYLHAFSYRIDSVNYAAIGAERYEDNSNLFDVGYMSNDTEAGYTTRGTTTVTVLPIGDASPTDDFVSLKFNSSYRYSEGIAYSSGEYRLQNSSTYSNLSQVIGKYTVNSTTNYGGAGYYILAPDPSKDKYYIAIKMTSGNLLAYYEKNYYYASNYTYDGTTYTLTSPTLIKRSQWYQNHALVSSKYLCVGSQSCTTMYKVTSLDSAGLSFNGFKTSNTYKFANNFTYSDGTYTLTGDVISSYDFNTDNNALLSHRYTCLSDSVSCNTLYYLYQKNWESLYLVILNSNTVADFVNNLLSVNSSESNIKSFVEEWYRLNMLSKTDKIEDTVYCNDRSVAALNGFDPNSGSFNSIAFNASTSNNLTCTRPIDQFAVSNTQAKLTYPVGLLTRQEANIINDANLLKTGAHYFLMSPYDEDAISAVSTTGSITYKSVASSDAVRPVITLKKDVSITAGSGSQTDPWIVE